MKNGKKLAIGVGLLGLALGASSVQAAGLGAWGMAKGDWDFTLGGGGTSDKEFNNNGGNFNASVGYFLSDAFEIALRQNLSFAVGAGGDAVAGQTRVAVDYHFKLGNKFRPYVGANFGGIYGDGVNDSFAAGLEAGLKYYVLQKTYLFGHFEWQWAFDDAGDAGSTFDDGAFIYAAGVGFNF
ncbi:MAG: hypothetical protein H7A45_02605 [Verrucomicrobiales bacterium]|nr:hypothetical protein [Verrucomicrobiales bacterium]MCP5526444.1 hypothetical protein [Verrucomicrobiales bacterium]